MDGATDRDRAGRRRCRVRVDAAVDEAALGRVLRSAGPMIGLPSETRVWLASGRDRHASRLRRLWRCWCRRRCKRDPHCGASVRVPRQARRSDQGAVARRPGHVPVGQAAGARPLPVAVARRASAVTITRGAARLPAGRHRLAAAATHRGGRRRRADRCDLDRHGDRQSLTGDGVL